MIAYFTPLLLSRVDNLILIWVAVWLVLSLLLWGWFCWKCLPKEFTEDS